MRTEQIGNATLYCGTMEETIGGIERVDHIFSDPPYLYIKTHDFDRPWDEQFFFENAKRLLSDDGFIALFGRGMSFYRWNTRLAELGFVFKEEIVWDKRYTTSPCMALSRVHETVSLHTKKTGKIHRSKVPYVEQKQYDIGSIIDNIRRIKKAVTTDIGLGKILDFLQKGKLYEGEYIPSHNISQQPGIKRPDRVISCVDSIYKGMNERSIIKYHKFGITTSNQIQDAPRVLKVVKSLRKGMNEKSIIELSSTHYNQSHPTQKPVRLAERILALISSPGDTIYDPFMGSGSFGVACLNTGRKYIGSEMKPEYFNMACKRIEEAAKQGTLDFQESA
jgi:site-specific DNA-methyltransferase (adenine-specific)